MSIIAILILKKGEVDNAPLPPASEVPTVYPPTGNPLMASHSGGAAPPIPASYSQQPPPQFTYANTQPEYTQSYPASYPAYVESPQPVVAPPDVSKNGGAPV